MLEGRLLCELVNGTPQPGVHSGPEVLHDLPCTETLGLGPACADDTRPCAPVKTDTPIAEWGSLQHKDGS